MSQVQAALPTVELEYKAEPHPDPVVAGLIDEVECLLRQVEEKRRLIAERLANGPDPG